jgi:hypothetical protein
MVKEGRILFFKIGVDVRFDKELITRWVNDAGGSILPSPIANVARRRYSLLRAAAFI